MLGDLVHKEGVMTDNHQNTLSSQIQELAQLLGLVLFQNEFSGEIPWIDLLSLTNLPELSLDFNSFSTRTIPTEIGIFLSTSLHHLGLGGIELTGTIPSEIAMMENRTVLDLSYNYLTGNIPVELPIFLQVIDLQDNQLAGTLPSTIGYLAHLYELSLTANLFSGDLSMEFGLMTAFGVFHLGNNNFTGNIQVLIEELSSLLWIDLSFNGLTGTIPPEIKRMFNLSFLELQGNHFIAIEPVVCQCQ